MTLYNLKQKRRRAIEQMEKANDQFKKGLISEAQRDEIYEYYGQIAEDYYELMGEIIRGSR